MVVLALYFTHTVETSKNKCVFLLYTAIAAAVGQLNDSAYI